MSLSAKVREQLLSSFRAELSEHVQTMTDGLLAIEQQNVSGDEKQALLDSIFRAAHSLKGASRAMGVTAVEQIAHALESVLDGIRREALDPMP
jgi:two-component system chemotaxis sensor kinase CheA